MKKEKKFIGSSETTRVGCFTLANALASCFCCAACKAKANRKVLTSAKAPKVQVLTSQVQKEELRDLAFYKKIPKKSLNFKTNFSYYLAGLIDGDGYLGLKKNLYASCEITLALKEVTVLLHLKKVLGGSVTLRQGVKAYRWRLHKKESMVKLIEMINGKLQTPEKKEALKKICLVFSIEALSSPFSIDNYWLSGFYEAEGYFHISPTRLQCSITISQKTPKILDLISSQLGGKVIFDKSWQGFVLRASAKDVLFTWFKYFSRFPLKSWKNIRFIRFRRIVLFKARGYHLSQDPLLKKRFERVYKSFLEK